MISSAIWDKSARVNFSKTNKIARARRASAICSLRKIYECGFIPNCTRKSRDYLLIIHIQNFTLREDVRLTDVFGRLPSIPCRNIAEFPGFVNQGTAFKF